MTFPNPHVITTMFALIEKEGVRMKTVNIFKVVLGERKRSRERRGSIREEGRGGDEREGRERAGDRREMCLPC